MLQIFLNLTFKPHIILYLDFILLKGKNNDCEYVSISDLKIVLSRLKIFNIFKKICKFYIVHSNLTLCIINHYNYQSNQDNKFLSIQTLKIENMRMYIFTRKIFAVLAMLFVYQYKMYIFIKKKKIYSLRLYHSHWQPNSISNKEYKGTVSEILCSSAVIVIIWL